MNAKHMLVGTITAIVAVGLFSFKVLTEGWAVNMKDAKVSFDMPNGKHTGTFGGLNSTFVFDPTDLSKSVIKASVDVNTVKTDGGDHLDEHLKSADFFDAANHPQITFSADSVVKSDPNRPSFWSKMRFRYRSLTSGVISSNNPITVYLS